MGRTAPFGSRAFINGLQQRTDVAVGENDGLAVLPRHVVGLDHAGATAFLVGTESGEHVHVAFVREHFLEIAAPTADRSWRRVAGKELGLFMVAGPAFDGRSAKGISTRRGLRLIYLPCSLELSARFANTRPEQTYLS